MPPESRTLTPREPIILRADRVVLSRSRLQRLRNNAAAANYPGYGSGIVDILTYLLDPEELPLHLAQTIAIRRDS